MKKALVVACTLSCLLLTAARAAPPLLKELEKASSTRLHPDWAFKRFELLNQQQKKEVVLGALARAKPLDTDACWWWIDFIANIDCSSVRLPLSSLRELVVLIGEWREPNMLDRLTQAACAISQNALNAQDIAGILSKAATSAEAPLNYGALILELTASQEADTRRLLVEVIANYPRSVRCSQSARQLNNLAWAAQALGPSRKSVRVIHQLAVRVATQRPKRAVPALIGATILLCRSEHRAEAQQFVEFLDRQARREALCCDDLVASSTLVSLIRFVCETEEGAQLVAKSKSRLMAWLCLNAAASLRHESGKPKHAASLLAVARKRASAAPSRALRIGAQIVLSRPPSDLVALLRKEADPRLYLLAIRSRLESKLLQVEVVRASAVTFRDGPDAICLAAFSFLAPKRPAVPKQDQVAFFKNYQP